MTQRQHDDQLRCVDDDIHDVDLSDHRVGANVIYASMSNIDMAKTTPGVLLGNVRKPVSQAVRRPVAGQGNYSSRSH